MAAQPDQGGALPDAQVHRAVLFRLNAEGAFAQVQPALARQDADATLGCCRVQRDADLHAAVEYPQHGVLQRWVEAAVPHALHGEFGVVVEEYGGTFLGAQEGSCPVVGAEARALGQIGLRRQPLPGGGGRRLDEDGSLQHDGRHGTRFADTAEYGANGAR